MSAPAAARYPTASVLFLLAAQNTGVCPSAFLAFTLARRVTSALRDATRPAQAAANRAERPDSSRRSIRVLGSLEKDQKYLCC